MWFGTSKNWSSIKQDLDILCKQYWNKTTLLENTNKGGENPNTMHCIEYRQLRNGNLDRTPNFCQNLVIFRSKNMYLKESLTRSSTVI